MLKGDEIANPNSCLNKAAGNEPVFVLRAQDKFAPVLVRLWAEMAKLEGTCPVEKRLEAMALATLMEHWPARRFPD